MNGCKRIHNQCETRYLLLELQKPINRHRNSWILHLFHYTDTRTEAVLTAFSVTTENFIGTINDAPPPIDIPLTSETYTQLYSVNTLQENGIWNTGYQNRHLCLLVCVDMIAKPIHPVNNLNARILCHKRSIIIIIKFSLNLFR